MAAEADKGRWRSEGADERKSGRDGESDGGKG